MDKISTPQGPEKPTSRMARMKPTTSWAPWPTRVRRSRVSSNKVPMDFRLGIAELDTEDHVRVETGDEVRQRGVGPEDVPEVHDQPGGRVTGRPDQVGALGHRADQGERKWFDRDAGSVGRCFVGDAAERFDEGCDVVHRGSELGPDLDERRPELLCRLEQQLPGPAPGEVVLTPPARGELDLDVLKAGGLDLGPERGKADGLADDLQVTLGEADAGPAGRCDGAYAVDRGERADLRIVERRDVAGAGPAGRDECRGVHAFRSTSTETPSAAERTAASARTRAARPSSKPGLVLGRPWMASTKATSSRR